MDRDFVFMSGDTAATLAATIAMDRWWHTCVADRLVMSDGIISDKFVHLSKRPGTKVRGVVMYADVDDKSIERDNLKFVIDNAVPCWPPAKTLTRMFDRFDVLRECEDLFFDHPVFFGSTDEDLREFNEYGRFASSVVMKMGNVHRGQGKFLSRDYDEPLPIVTGPFSIEPFFGGTSVRALLVGGDVFGIRVDNDRSWIKNSAGADVSAFKLDPELELHARNVASFFELEIAGIDYVVDDEGFHLLEVNHVPGITGFDDVHAAAKEFFVKKMKEVEDHDARCT